MSLQGTLISRNFINLLTKYALPAKAQLMIVDSVTGDILYPYDVSNFYGNAELGYTNVGGDYVYSDQDNYRIVEGYNQVNQVLDWAYAFDGSNRYTFSVDSNLLYRLRDSTNVAPRMERLFDPSDPSSGGWKLDVIQVDIKNDPSGPPIVSGLNDLYQIGGSGKWWFGSFDYDPSSGQVEFTLRIKTVNPYSPDTTYYDIAGGDLPKIYFRLSWDFALIDKVANLRNSGNRSEVFIGNLPRA